VRCRGRRSRRFGDGAWRLLSLTFWAVSVDPARRARHSAFCGGWSEIAHHRRRKSWSIVFSRLVTPTSSSWDVPRFCFVEARGFRGLAYLTAVGSDMGRHACGTSSSHHFGHDVGRGFEGDEGVGALECSGNVHGLRWGHRADVVGRYRAWTLSSFSRLRINTFREGGGIRGLSQDPGGLRSKPNLKNSVAFGVKAAVRIPRMGRAGSMNGPCSKLETSTRPGPSCPRVTILIGEFPIGPCRQFLAGWQRQSAPVGCVALGLSQATKGVQAFPAGGTRPISRPALSQRGDRPAAWGRGSRLSRSSRRIV